jgi:hypothetical protein
LHPQLLGCLTLLALLAGCSDAPSIGSGAPTKLPQYHGLSHAQVIERLGKPKRDDQFAMSQAVGEFRVELLNTYPLSDPANADVQIQELTWEDGSYNITLWLHQVGDEWVVLNSCRWHKDVRF